jgi:hypothetical protein
LSDPLKGTLFDSSLPTKKGDSGKPVISISIGSTNFDEAICDFSASINIMPQVIYDKLFNYPLSCTTMCLQLADQSLCYPVGIMEETCVRVGNSYIPVDYIVVNTGTDTRSPVTP